MRAKKIKRVAVSGGANIKVTDKWVQNVAMHLKEHKADEVITTGQGNASLIAEKAAAMSDIPNVILPIGKIVERADILLSLPGGSSTRTITRMFLEQKKGVVNLVGEG